MNPTCALTFAADVKVPPITFNVVIVVAVGVSTPVEPAFQLTVPPLRFKTSDETFVQSDVINNPNYWSDYQTEAEEKAEQDKFEAEVVRAKRDALLNKYEWTVNSPDLTTAKQTEWKTYRQALRDLPDQSGFPWEADGMTWPTKPTS